MKILLGILFFALTWCRAFAEPAPLRLTLKQALEMAAKSNPDIGVVIQSLEVAKTSRAIAGQGLNPSLLVSAPIGPAERKQSLVFTLPLETGGRREARLAVADSGIKEATINLEQMRQQVLNQTRNAFVELALARESLKQTQSDVAFFDRLVDAAQRRYDAGDVAEAEVIRVCFEREQARRNLFPAENRIEIASVALNRMLGLPLDTRVEIQDEGWIFPSDTQLKATPWQIPELNRLRDSARQRRPDLALTSQQRETSRLLVELSRANQSPAVSLQGSLLWNPVVPSFTYLVGVQVELMWGSDRGGEVEQAQARLREAEMRLQATLAQADLAVVTAWSKFQAARKQLFHDLEVLQPQSERVLFLAEKIYQIGQGDITEVLLVGQSVQRQRQLLLMDLAQLHQALGELELAVNASFLGDIP